MRTQDAEKARKRVRKAPEGVLTVDDVAVIAGEKLTITVGLPNVLKLKFHSHHQMERWDLSQAGRWLKGDAVGFLRATVHGYGIYINKVM